MDKKLIRDWSRRIIAAIIGGIGGYFLGNAMMHAGGSCPVLCNPWMAAVFGAITGYGLFYR
ncbi:MAG: YtxH domain-containing protein [Candidatus Eremiobacteraeota bacterium]|nr:YtxH domain-containing protein [Candidatus Eremiobacteraeota bacterium]